MGNSRCELMSQAPDLLDEYKKKGEYQLPWCGVFSVYESNKLGNPKKILHKKLYMKDAQQAKALTRSIENQKRPHFYLIKPLCLKIEHREQICSQSSTVNAYHADFLPSLADRMNENLKKQVNVWFILNEVVHSLEVLYDKKNAAHLWISLQTIYSSENQNWMLQDMRFWWGYHFQDLITAKIMRKNQIISPYMRQLALNTEVVDLPTAIDEDVFCLGFTILSLMTGLSFNICFPSYSKLLVKCRENYSDKLLSLVSEMIEPDPKKRINFQRLKMKLKIDQEQIMTRQIKEFQRTNSVVKIDQPSILQKSQCLTPPRFSLMGRKHTNMQTEPNTEARTQTFFSPAHERSKLFGPRHSPAPSSLKQQKHNKIKDFRLEKTHQF